MLYRVNGEISRVSALFIYQIKLYCLNCLFSDTGPPRLVRPPSKRKQGFPSPLSTSDASKIGRILARHVCRSVRLASTPRPRRSPFSRPLLFVLACSIFVVVVVAFFFSLLPLRFLFHLALCCSSPTAASPALSKPVLLLWRL